MLKVKNKTFRGIHHTSTEKNVLSRGMPNDDAGTLDVGNQFYDWLGQIPGQSPLWNLPHLDCTVL